MKQQISTLIVLMNAPFLGHAAITITSDAAAWVAVNYPGVVSDYASDTQATSIDLDLVGDASHAAFYTVFDNGGTPDLHTDGEVGFRLRMAGDKPPASFGGQAWIGMDVNADGALDIFVGANASTIGIHDAGTGLNNSPNTTTINATALWSTATSATNFLWTPVTAALDSHTTNFDIDNDNKPDPDYFLTFIVPFSQIVNAVQTLTGVTSFDDTSPLAYVAATASQGNSLNADLNGVSGGVNSTVTWSALGAISPTITITGSEYAVPEPAVAALAAGLAALIILGVRRRD